MAVGGGDRECDWRSRGLRWAILTGIAPGNTLAFYLILQLLLGYKSTSEQLSSKASILTLRD